MTLNTKVNTLQKSVNSNKFKAHGDTIDHKLGLRDELIAQIKKVDVRMTNINSEIREIVDTNVEDMAKIKRTAKDLTQKVHEIAESSESKKGSAIKINSLTKKIGEQMQQDKFEVTSVF